MAGNLFWKESSIVTVTSTGASITNLSAASAGTIDCRAAGTANLIEQLVARASLTVQWVTITSIANGTDVADLYLLPAIDGTNYPDTDLTAGASHIPASAYVGSFICAKAPTTNTNMLFDSPDFELRPWLYTVYLLNQSGQTMTANWTLKILAAQGQYS